MKLILNDKHVELPNGFYYMLPFRIETLPSRAAYWVADHEILEMLLEDIDKYGLIISPLSKIENMVDKAATAIYLIAHHGKAWYDTNDGYPINLTNVELLLRESAKFYGLI